MVNTTHLVRRQSSQNFNPQRSWGRLEMKGLRGRLFVEHGNSNISHNYGVIIVDFDDTSPNTKVYLRIFQIVTPAKVSWP
jgi:hypothetical protein